MTNKEHRWPPPPLLHIYSTPGEHEATYIIGNREGMLALMETCAKALADGKAWGSAITTDGEGFDLFVLYQNNPWATTPWTRLTNVHPAGFFHEEKGTGKPPGPFPASAVREEAL